MGPIVTSVVQRQYWFGTRSYGVVNVNADETDLPDYGARAAYFEQAVSNRNVGVKIRDLTKVIIMYDVGAEIEPEIGNKRKMNCRMGNQNGSKIHIACMHFLFLAFFQFLQLCKGFLAVFRCIFKDSCVHFH